MFNISLFTLFLSDSPLSLKEKNETNGFFFTFFWFKNLVSEIFHSKGDELAKLNFEGLDFIFRSTRVQIRIPRGQIG
jgi:hypothetical protein